MADIVALTTFAFLAGFVDAAAGGGGLIQIPALFTYLPGAAPALLFGTNKLASVAGTSVAALQLAAAVPVRWPAAAPAALVAFAFSFLGAHAVAAVPPQVLRPLVLLLLVAVAIFSLARKGFGLTHAPRHQGLRERIHAVALGAAIGFYDGFFGPGTGSFLIFLFVRFFGFDFLRAAAAAKVVNVATNLAALSYFGLAGAVLYPVALPMAAANGLGAIAGARLAVARGSPFVRALFLAVVWAMVLKFAYDTFAH